ncbi:hypothetical protein TKK_0004332 [Trichogramma kaykai]|uniref:RING-type domain-containing protein n=1 Tax=Trichogramma kaykai TaxID=54128 RepID=A0ABD2XMW8_9HYME
MEQEQQRVTRLAQQQQQRQKQNQQQQQQRSCDYSLSQDAIYKVFTYLNSNSLYASEEGDSTGADKLLDDAARSGSSSRSSCISGENSTLYAEIGAAERDRDGDEDDEYDDRTPDEGKVLLDDDDDDDYEAEQEEKEAEQELETRYILEEMKYSDARRAICSLCRYSLGRAGTGLVEDFERALLCSDGHLLCHRCVQKLAVKSDTNCPLCSVAESRASMSTSASLPPPRNNNNSSSSSSGDSGRLRGGTSEALQASTTTKPVAHRSRSGARAKKRIAPPSAARRVVSRGPPPQPQPQQQQRHRRDHHRDDRYGATVQTLGTSSIINAQTLSECSRRPIQCPRLDCAVNVAFSALANHFMFDHPEVPILGVDPGERSTFVFDYDDLDDDSSRCLALLLVSNKLSGPAARQFNGMHVHPRYKNRLPLPLLAARLATCYGASDSAEIRNGCGVENEAVVHRSIDDVVIAWVAGLDIGSSANVTLLRYSVQAFDVVDDNGQECGGGRSLTYTGPINSLRTAQRPREVFLTGDCVILHAGFIRHVTSRDCRNININVVVH